MLLWNSGVSPRRSTSVRMCAHSGWALAPEPAVAGGEGGVGDHPGYLAGTGNGQETAAGIAEIVFGVGVLAGGDRPNPRAGPIGVDNQQRAFEHLTGVQVDPDPGRDQGVQAAGAQRGLGEHVQQRDHAPAGADRGFEPAKVTRLRRGGQRGQHDRELLPLHDPQPGQIGQGVVERGQLGVHRLDHLGDEPGRFAWFA